MNLTLMTNRFISLLLLISLASCNLENKKLTGIDTAAVFEEVLKSKSFLEDNIKEDTLYVVKSKFYNHAYPKNTKYFKVIFIEDTPNNRALNYPDKQNDKRIRLDVVKFTLKNDTLALSIADCGVNMGYEYKLVKFDGCWNIVSEQVILN